MNGEFRWGLMSLRKCFFYKRGRESINHENIGNEI
jgi:hypothetical protein